MNELLRRALILPPQASSVSHGMDVLHYTVIVTALGVAFLTFLTIAIFLVRYRERPGYVPSPRRISHRFEVGAAIFTLMVFLVWWGFGFREYREIHTPVRGSTRIYVVGKQWMWQFVYPNGMAAENDLRIPVGKPIEVAISSRDVIHSFYVPAFRIKQDAVPGRVTTMWFTATRPGTYEILCAEYCGAGHSRMRGRIIAMPPADYATWVAGHPAVELARTGEKLAADYGCLRCHTVDGTPHIGPTWLGLYGSKVPLAGGGSTVADDAYLTESMMDPLAKIVSGYAPVMPSFLGQLSGPDAAAIVEYIRSLGGKE